MPVATTLPWLPTWQCRHRSQQGAIHDGRGRNYSLTTDESDLIAVEPSGLGRETGALVSSGALHDIAPAQVVAPMPRQEHPMSAA